MKVTGWMNGLQVTMDGAEIVSHAGVALIRALADNMGLTGGFSRALSLGRLLVHCRAVLDAAITALPPAFRRRLMITCDGAAASHDRITRLDSLVARPGCQAIYSVGQELGAREQTAIAAVPARARQIAVDARGEARERRADEARGDLGCGHCWCWIEEAHVTELTSLLREGPAGDQLAAWPATMRIFARRQRPHPGAQLTLLEAEDGWSWAADIVTAWEPISALPQAPEQRQAVPAIKKGAPGARGTPATPARQPGCCYPP